jgi:hypothetical protein
MVIMGFWWVITGFVAIVDDTFYVVTQEWVFKFDTTTWGWIHLILGIGLRAVHGQRVGTDRRGDPRGGGDARCVRMAAVLPDLGDCLHRGVDRRHLGADRARERPRRELIPRALGVPKGSRRTSEGEARVLPLLRVTLTTHPTPARRPQGCEPASPDRERSWLRSVVPVEVPADVVEGVVVPSPPASWPPSSRPGTCEVVDVVAVRGASSREVAPPGAPSSFPTSPLRSLVSRLPAPEPRDAASRSTP